MPKLTQKELDNLNRPDYIYKEIKSIINNFQKRKHQDQIILLVNSTKNILYQFSIISFRIQKQREYCLTHSMRAACPQYQNPTKTQQQKKKATKHYEYWCTSPQKNIIKLNPMTYTPQQSMTYSRCANLVQHLKINKYNSPTD